jgi:hypothetical protein
MDLCASIRQACWHSDRPCSRSNAVAIDENDFRELVEDVEDLKKQLDEALRLLRAVKQTVHKIDREMP